MQVNHDDVHPAMNYIADLQGMVREKNKEINRWKGIVLVAASLQPYLALVVGLVTGLGIGATSIWLMMRH